MECKNTSDLLIDYYDKKLPQTLSEEIEQHLKKCEKCRTEFHQIQKMMDEINTVEQKKPDKKLRRHFEEMLADEKQILNKSTQDKKTIQWSFSPFFQVAAALLLLIVGYFVGLNVSNFSDEKSHSQEQIAALQDDLNRMKQMVVFAMLEKQSASERIKAVSYVDNMSRPNDEVINALIETLNNDDNTNVRLAAAKALAKFAQLQKVREALLWSLESQTDPSLQIAIINILVEIEEHKAVQPMKKLIEDENTHEVVKKQAEIGISVLI